MDGDDVLHPDTLSPAPHEEVFAGTLLQLKNDLANLHRGRLQSYAGLTVSEGPPCCVRSVGDLIDPNFRRQGETGYLNFDVKSGDRILAVDGQSTHHLCASELQGELALEILDSVRVCAVRRWNHLTHPA